MSDTKQSKTRSTQKSAKAWVKQKPKTIPVMTGSDTPVGRIARYMFYTLLAYAPVHIFFSTWIGTSLDVLAPAKVAKELFLLLGFALALTASVKKPWFKGLLSDKLMWAIGGFALLHLIVMAMRPTDPQAELLALAYNTRYLLFFVYAVLLAHLYSRAHLVKRSLQVVLATAGFVLVFGVLQHSVLPPNTMERIGYSQQAGTLPAFYIDDNPELYRVFSTQRNPNSYGSYLLIIIAIAMVYLRFARQHASRYVLVGLLGLGLINLLYTYSRSAWLGFVFVVLTLVVLLIKQGIHRKIKRETKLILSAVSIALVLVAGSVIYTLSDNMTMQNMIFHTTTESTATSSDSVRVMYWQSSFDTIRENPMGGGLGVAAPAAMQTNDENINKNYYLQIAIEVGVLGLLLFLTILGLVFKRLWGWSSQSPIAVALLASFVGLLLTNMFSHIWMYEAVAYTWWGLAGLFIVLDNRRKQTASGSK